MVGFVTSDGDGYFNVVITLVESGSEASQLLQTALNKDSESTSSKTGKSGTDGVNLNLIDRINANTPKKGYIKELLEMCRDGQNGKLTSNKYNLSVETTLGMWMNEVGHDDDYIPMYYFKPSTWKENSKDNSFAGFTSNSSGDFSRVDDSGTAVGAFQYTNGGTYKCGTKSKIDPVNNTRKDASGDARFWPDCYTVAENSYSAVMSNRLKAAKLSNSAKSMSSGMVNSRGDSGFIRSIFGGIWNSDKCVSADKSKQTSADLNNTIGYLSEVYDNWWEKNSSGIGKKILQYSEAAKSRAGALAIVAHEDDWYISQSCYVYYCNGGKSLITNAWQDLFPDEKDKGWSYIQSKLKNMVSTGLSDSIQKTTGVSVTKAECDNVYGESEKKTYDFGGAYGYYIWHVSTERATGSEYNNKYSDGTSPFLVSRFDSILFGYSLVTYPAVGEYVYANLLKEAGVNSVDPTDIKTYMNQYYVESSDGSTDSSGTWTAEGAGITSEDAKKALKKPKLVDFSSLSGTRAKVVEKAIWMVNTKKFVYAWAGRGSTKDTYFAKKYTKNDHIWGGSYSARTGSEAFYDNLKLPMYGVDCSGFIYACYNLALGATTSAKLAYYSTSSIPSSGVWKKIDDSQLKPGDILNISTTGHHHVVMYMGKDSGGYQVIEAQCAGTYVKCSYPWTKTSGYVAYRYTGLK